MEPPVVSFRRYFGPVVAFFKKVVRKCIRWYVQPQVDVLEAKLAQLREEFALLMKQHNLTQALVLQQYQELFRRMEQLEMQPDQPTGKAA